VASVATFAATLSTCRGSRSLHDLTTRRGMQFAVIVRKGNGIWSMLGILGRAIQSAERDEDDGEHELHDSNDTACSDGKNKKAKMICKQRKHRRESEGVLESSACYSTLALHVERGRRHCCSHAGWCRDTSVSDGKRRNI
jgi:hypothetical protein